MAGTFLCILPQGKASGDREELASVEEASSATMIIAPCTLRAVKETSINSPQ